MKFDIYYMDPCQAQFITAKLFPREFYAKVAEFETDRATVTLDDVFYQMNHVDENTFVSRMYPQLRSMSVGDVIVDEFDDAFIVDFSGFKRVEFRP